MAMELSTQRQEDGPQLRHGQMVLSSLRSSIFPVQGGSAHQSWGRVLSLREIQLLSPVLSHTVKDNASFMPRGYFLDRVTGIRQDGRGMFP